MVKKSIEDRSSRRNEEIDTSEKSPKTFNDLSTIYEWYWIPEEMSGYSLSLSSVTAEDSG